MAMLSLRLVTTLVSLWLFYLLHVVSFMGFDIPISPYHYLELHVISFYGFRQDVRVPAQRVPGTARHLPVNFSLASLSCYKVTILFSLLARRYTARPLLAGRSANHALPAVTLLPSLLAHCVLAATTL